MTTPMRETACAVLSSRAAKFTADVRAGKYPIPPVELHAGNQMALFAEGASVRFRAGTGYEGVYTVVDTEIMNGYANVSVRPVKGPAFFARQDDLVAA